MERSDHGYVKRETERWVSRNTTPRIGAFVGPRAAHGIKDSNVWMYLIAHEFVQRMIRFTPPLFGRPNVESE
jgi:hypothetical protein